MEESSVMSAAPLAATSKESKVARSCVPHCAVYVTATCRGRFGNTWQLAELPHSRCRVGAAARVCYPLFFFLQHGKAFLLALFDALSPGLGLSEQDPHHHHQKKKKKKSDKQPHDTSVRSGKNGGLNDSVNSTDKSASGLPCT